MNLFSKNLVNTNTNLEIWGNKMKSVNWSIDELKLALELYLSLGTEKIAKLSKKSPEVVALSSILKRLDTVPKETDEKYRSVNAVHLKLMNFHSVDNSYKGIAMSNVGKGDKEIWNRYHDKLDVLREEVSAFLKIHFVGKKDETLIKYFSRIEDMSGRENSYSSESNDVGRAVKQLRRLIEKNKNIQFIFKNIREIFQGRLIIGDI